MTKHKLIICLKAGIIILLLIVTYLHNKRINRLTETTSILTGWASSGVELEIKRGK